MKPTPDEFKAMGATELAKMTPQQSWLYLQRVVNDIGLALFDSDREHYPSYHVRRLLGVCQAWIEQVETERQAAAVKRIHDMVEWNQMGPGIKDEEAAHALFMDGQEYDELTGLWHYPDYDPTDTGGDDPPERESDETFYNAQGWPDHD